MKTDAGRLVLKRMSLSTDWIMEMTEDYQGRSLTLWRYGLLDQLFPHLEHKIIAGSIDGDGWAILMEDLTGYTFDTWQNPLTPEFVRIFLDRLARFHATFWNDQCLTEPALGICNSEQLLSTLSLCKIQDNKHPSIGPL